MPRRTRSAGGAAPELDVSAAAALNVSKEVQPDAVQPLLRLIESERLVGFSSVWATLLDLGAPSVQAFVKLLGHRSRSMRYWAGWCLSRLGKTAAPAGTALQACLKSEPAFS